MRTLKNWINEKLVICPKHKVQEKLVINNNLGNVKSTISFNTDVKPFFEKFKKHGITTPGAVGFKIDSSEKYLNNFFDKFISAGTQVTYAEAMNAMENDNKVIMITEKSYPLKWDDETLLLYAKTKTPYGQLFRIFFGHTDRMSSSGLLSWTRTECRTMSGVEAEKNVKASYIINKDIFIDTLRYLIDNNMMSGRKNSRSYYMTKNKFECVLGCFEKTLK